MSMKTPAVHTRSASLSFWLLSATVRIFICLRCSVLLNGKVKPLLFLIMWRDQYLSAN